MKTTTEFYRQAELALASYSTLYSGISDIEYIQALQNDNKGMSPTQTLDFAANWTVIDQYNHSESIEILDEMGNPTGLYREVSNGLSVTLFAIFGGHNTNLKYLFWLD